MTNMIVYAIHNFEAENEDEINFLIGEPITVLEKDEKYLDGWWQGRNINGETGLFPMNYTTTEKPIIQQSTETEQFEPDLPQHPTMTSPLSLPQLSANTYMPSPHLSSRSSGSTIEDEIDDALSQLQSATITSNTITPDIILNDINNTTKAAKIENWDVDQVADWLKSVGLDSVSRNFIDQEITGDILLDLNIDALKELGITTFGKRYKIMQAITSLKEESSVEINKPTPNTSVSTSAISRPASRKSINSLKRSNSQNDSSSDVLYQFPRKAPLPPGGTSSKSTDLMRPISPQSLSSSGVSRSNTFNTVSSGGTLKSRDLSPDPKGFRSPRRVLSQKSQQTFDSIDKEHSQSQISSTHTTTTTTSSSIHNNSNINPIKNDWMSISDVVSIHSTTNNNNATSNIHPLNTPTASLSSSRQPMQISNAHKLSVSSFDDTTNLANRQSTTEAFQAPEHEGWLHKQSDKYKIWNKRWFVLKGSNLFYFKSPKDVRMKGIINLRGYKIIVDESIHAGKYCFKAQHDRERTFFFYTDTEESMRVWLKMLMKTTIARDFTAPVMSSNHIATVSLDVARRMRPRPPSVIMYKNQKQLKINNDPKMSMLEEDEEGESNLIHTEQHQNSPIPQFRQTRESGITMYQQQSEEEGDQDEIPPLPGHYPTQQQQQIHHQMMLNDEEEDLIDPQHRSLPLSSSLSVTSSISNNSNSGDEWSSEQYINWINAYLPAGKKAIDLTSAFRNGDTLIQLLEAISQKEVRRPPTQKGGSMSVMMLDNIVAAFKFMGREGVEVDGRYTIKDVFGGNEEKIITMLDAIKTWADHTYPMNTTAIKNDMMPSSKKSNTSVLIGKDSGWRGSAMMDNRHTFSDDGF